MILSFDETSIHYACPEDGLEFDIALTSLTAGSRLSPYHIATANTHGLWTCSNPKHAWHNFRNITRQGQGYDRRMMSHNGIHRWLYDNGQVHADQLTFLDDEATAPVDVRPLPESDDDDAVPLIYLPTPTLRTLTRLVKLVTDGGVDSQEVIAFPVDLNALLKLRSIAEIKVLVRNGLVYTLDDDTTLGAFATAILGETAERDAFVTDQKSRKTYIAPAS